MSKNNSQVFAEKTNHTLSIEDLEKANKKNWPRLGIEQPDGPGSKFVVKSNNIIIGTITRNGRIYTRTSGWWKLKLEKLVKRTLVSK
jgi:hypothetical protein